MKRIQTFTSNNPLNDGSRPVWLVTGASSGVGRVLAVALGASGADVVLSARNRGLLEDTARWTGPRASVFPADLSDPGSVDRLTDGILGYLAGRPLAGIVHAAGVMAWDSPEAPGGWSRVPAVNALAPWRLTLGLEPALLAVPGARVLLVAGAPFTFKGTLPGLTGWRGSQPGLGMALALEAASAKVWMARVLGRRWAGVASAFAFHPGFIRSRLADGLPFPLNILGCAAQPFLAARCLVGEFLALAPDAPGLSGTLVSGRKAVPGVPFPEDPATEEAWVRELPTRAQFFSRSADL